MFIYIYIISQKYFQLFGCFCFKRLCKTNKIFLRNKNVLCYNFNIYIYVYKYIKYIYNIYIYIYIYVYNIDIYIYIYDFFLQIITNLSLQKVLNLLNLLCFGSCPKALQIVSQKSSLNFWMKELWALENHLLAIVTLLQLFHRGAVSIHWYIAQNI